MTMSDREPSSGDATRRNTAGDASGLERALDIDPGTTDLGDDVNREATNRGTVLGDDNNAAMEGGLDPGNTDLGDDVYR